MLCIVRWETQIPLLVFFSGSHQDLEATKTWQWKAYSLMSHGWWWKWGCYARWRSERACSWMLEVDDREKSELIPGNSLLKLEITPLPKLIYSHILQAAETWHNLRHSLLCICILYNHPKSDWLRTSSWSPQWGHGLDTGRLPWCYLEDKEEQDISAGPGSIALDKFIYNNTWGSSTTPEATWTLG